MSEQDRAMWIGLAFGTINGLLVAVGIAFTVWAVNQ